MSFDYIDYISKKIKLFVDYIKNYISDTKYKLNNLESTNIELAKQYLDNNKLNEAYSRLRIIHFLWPNNIDGAYFYAILLVFSEKKEKAVNILDKFDNEYISRLLYIVNNYDSNYILDVVEKSNIKLSELKNVL